MSNPAKSLPIPVLDHFGVFSISDLRIRVLDRVAVLINFLLYPPLVQRFEAPVTGNFS